MTGIRRLARDTLLVAFGQAGAMAALFIQGILVARHLGPTVYGQWVVIAGIFNLLASFLSFRTSDAVTAFWMDRSYESQDRRNSLFSTAVYAELLTRLAAAASGAVVAILWINAPKNGASAVGLIPILVCALTKILGLMTPVWTSLTRASRQMRLFAIVPAVQAWCSLALISVLFFSSGASIDAVAVALLLTEVAGLVLRWTTMPKITADGRPGAADLALASPRLLYLERTKHLQFWRMMSAGYISSCLSSLIKESDVLIVGWLGTPALAGIYRVAKSLITTMQTAVATLSTVIIQDFVDALRKERIDEVKTLLSKVAPIVACAVACACLIAVIFVDDFISLVLGRAFAAARVPFLYLLPGIAIATAFFWVQPLAVALQASATILRIGVLNFIVYVATLTTAAFFIGPWAAALALSVAWGFGHIALLLMIWPELDRKCHPQRS